MLRRLPQVLALLTLSGASFALRAQGADGDDGTAITARASWALLATGCASERPRYFTANESEHCRVMSLRELTVDGDTAWYLARYRRSLRGEIQGQRDSVDYDELLLVARPLGSVNVWLRWQWRRDRSIEFLDTLSWDRTSSGVFLSLTTCLNGTGGCAQHYLHRERGQWVIVRQAFISALANRLPPDHALHKGQRIDLARMEGTWPVARSADGNCCPSLEVSFRLRLKGSVLELAEMSALRPVSPR